MWVDSFFVFDSGDLLLLILLCLDTKFQGWTSLRLGLMSWCRI
jgi:hypothetical protein